MFANSVCFSKTILAIRSVPKCRRISDWCVETETHSSATAAGKHLQHSVPFVARILIISQFVSHTHASAIAFSDIFVPFCRSSSSSSLSAQLSIDCRRSAAPGTNDTEWKMPARHVPIRVSCSIFFFQLVFRWCLRREVRQEEKRENERVSPSIAKWHNFFSSLAFAASAFRVNLPFASAWIASVCFK